MAITPTRQRNSVAQGIALGLAIRGVWSFPYDKFKTDLALEAAWLRWYPRSEFSQVTTDFSRGSSSRLLTSTYATKHVTLYWESVAGELAIRCHLPDWDPVRDQGDADLIVSLLAGDLRLSDWQDLADDFLAGLKLEGRPSA